MLNFSNDLFEVGRPNRARHAVWDGWAVRIESAPEGGLRFPGRTWLFSQSHLVFALRKWMHTPQPEDDLGFPSEGGLNDLIIIAQTVHSERQIRTAEQEAIRREQAEAYADAGAQAYDETALIEMLEALGYDNEETLRDAAGVRAVQGRRAVGDIVTIHYGEPSRSVEVTAALLRRGAQVRSHLRRQVERAIRREEDEVSQARYRESLPPQPTPVPEGLLTEQVQAVLWGTPFDDFLDRVQAMEASHGLAVTIVTLPLDVQVLPSQFAKYEAQPIDMSESLLLLDDVADAARRRGMRAVNPLAAIQPAGDPAYLDNDLHLSAVGHAALAKAVHAVLEQPPLRLPGLGLPEGRSRVPVEEEFLAVGENLVRGSTKNRCATYALREWFHMNCREGDREVLAGVRLTRAPEETFGKISQSSLKIWMPIFPGRDADIDVLWAERQEQLQVRWPTADGPPSMAFQSLETSPVEATMTSENPESVILVGASASCESPHSSCSDGRRAALPDCAPGTANAGSAGHCLTLCSETGPCASGICSAWHGGMVCL